MVNSTRPAVPFSNHKERAAENYSSCSSTQAHTAESYQLNLHIYTARRNPMHLCQPMLRPRNTTGKIIRSMQQDQLILYVCADIHQGSVVILKACFVVQFLYAH